MADGSREMARIGFDNQILRRSESLRYIWIIAANFWGWVYWNVCHHALQ